MGKMLSANTILVKGKITAEDVIRLQRDLFAEGVHTATEAELLFRMEADCAERDESWNAFFVDALAEYYIFHTEPTGELSEEGAQHLIQHILSDGHVAGETELALAIRVAERARVCPVDVGYLILKAVWDSVMDPAKAAYGQDRHPGVITAEDVSIIRKAIHAKGSDDGIAVSRAEAELLFALERETEDEGNDLAWRDLFVQAISARLLAPRSGTRDEVDGAEARWLVEQVSKDANIRRNERALLAFLYGKLDNGHPALAPLFAVAGLR